MDLEMYADRAVKGRTLNGPSLRAIPILLPPLDEQRRIVDIVSVADDQVSTADSLANILRSLRSALLADLLSGDHEIPASYDELLSA
jgi:type I restriction enzyme S subunit